MNAYERVMNRLSGKAVDRLPNLSLTMMFAAKEAGVSFGTFCSDHHALVDGALKCYEKYGIDMVCAISDPMREAEGFGAKVIIEEDRVPYCREKRIVEPEDIDALKVIDPSQGRRMSDRLEAVRLLRERVGTDAPVIGWVEGPMAESCDLMGVQEFLMLLMEEPEACRQLLDKCLEQGERFAQAQIACGADIIGVGDAVTSLIGPELYREFAFPYQRRLIERIHALGSRVKLHICGNLNPVLDQVALTGADIVDLDFMVDMERAADLFPREISLCGNFNPVTVVYQGDADLIRSEVRRCAGIAGRNRCMIAPGCEIPKDTSPANVLAIHDALVELAKESPD